VFEGVWKSCIGRVFGSQDTTINKDLKEINDKYLGNKMGVLKL
jgi:hypothetical protein